MRYEHLAAQDRQCHAGNESVVFDVSPVDSAGLYLAVGILVALHDRERTGVGRWVQTSLVESMVAMMDFQAARWTVDGVVPGQLAGLELRHRQHARVEDRIREAKASGLRNLPFNSFDANKAWFEIVMAATDLVAWAKLIGFTDHPDLARCEIDTFRYRVLHVAPVSPAAPDKPGSPSTPPGSGPKRSPLPGYASAPHSPNTRPPRPRRNETPSGPGKPAHPTRHRAPCHARLRQSTAQTRRNR